MNLEQTIELDWMIDEPKKPSCLCLSSIVVLALNNYKKANDGRVPTSIKVVN